MMNLKSLRQSAIAIATITVVLASQVAYGKEAIRTRHEIPEQFKWNLEEIYPDISQMNSDKNLILNDYLPKISQFKGKLNTAKNVSDYFKLNEKLNRTLGKIYVYSGLLAKEDTANNASAELSANSDILYSKVLSANSFANPELIALPEATIQSLIQDPLLKDYKEALELILHQKEHTLSEKEEAILANASSFASDPQNIYSQATSSDMKFPEVYDSKGNSSPLSIANFTRLLESKDRVFRKNTFYAFFKTFDKSRNTLATALASQINQNAFYAKSRKFDSSLDASLYSEFIPRSVFDNLIASANQNTKYLHKYINLRKKTLGLEGVHFYDLYTPLMDNYEIKIGFNDARKTLQKCLEPLGNDYTTTLSRAFDNRWIDVYETQNKYPGAFQWGAYDTHPYVSLNYSDNFTSFTTLAHEMGHAMHSYYTDKTQNYTNAGTPIFLAEIASTTNELLVLEYFLKNAKDENERLYLLNSYVELIRSTVFSQVMYSEFEKTIAESVENGESLSANKMNGIWDSLLVKYFGADFVIDDYTKLWWARIPHFYNSFYVYKYATSLAAANQLVQDILASNNAEKYLEFLKSGSKIKPIELLQKIGVDMNSSKPLDSIFNRFDQLLDEMEAILKKQGKLSDKTYAEVPLTIEISDNKANASFTPILKNGIPVSPLRKLAQSLGASVLWNAPDKIFVSKDDVTIELKIGSDTAIVNGTNKKMHTEVSHLDHSTTGIDMEFLTDALGYKMKKDDVSKIITIMK